MKGAGEEGKRKKTLRLELGEMILRATDPCKIHVFLAFLDTKQISNWRWLSGYYIPYCMYFLHWITSSSNYMEHLSMQKSIETVEFLHATRMCTILWGTISPLHVRVFSDNTGPPGIHMDLQVKLHYQKTIEAIWQRTHKKRAWYALGFSEAWNPYTCPGNIHSDMVVIIMKQKEQQYTVLKPKTPSPIQQFLFP